MTTITETALCWHISARPREIFTMVRKLSDGSCHKTWDKTWLYNRGPRAQAGLKALYTCTS